MKSLYQTEGCLEALDNLGSFIDYQYNEVGYGFPRLTGTMQYGCDTSVFNPDSLLGHVFVRASDGQARHRKWVQRKAEAEKRLKSRMSTWVAGRRDRISTLYGRVTHEEYGRIKAEYAALGQAVADLKNNRGVERLLALLNTGGALVCGPDQIRMTLGRQGIDMMTKVQKCYHCGTWEAIAPEGQQHLGEYNRVLCSGCVDSSYVWSDHLQCYILGDNVVYAVDTYDHWESDTGVAVSAGWAQRNCRYANDRYITSRMYDSLVYEGEIEDDYDRDGVIGSYHSSKAVISKPIVGTAGYPLLGMELEVEAYDVDRQTGATRVLSAIKLFKTDSKKFRYCATERDGSLNDGFEIVTAPCTLDVHAEQLKALMGDTFKGLKSHDTQTCGLHVHVDRRGTTNLQRGKIVQFINDPANEKLITAIARRYGRSSGYARIKTKTLLDGANAEPEYGDRYEAVNLTNQNTIEFRIFRGTLRYESVMACLEFSRAVWHFTKHAGIGELTTEGFLSYVSKAENRRDTRNLRQVLFERGLLTSKRPVLREMTPAPRGEQ